MAIVWPVITLMSGTLSGDRSTVLGLRSKASRRIRFLEADPHSRYKPMMSRPRRSTSSMHLRTITGTDAVAGACANDDRELEMAPLSRVTTDSRSTPATFQTSITERGNYTH